MIGWYSQKSADIYGTAIYARADGSRVAITEVTDESTHNSNWDDIVSVGEVTAFVRANWTHQIGERYGR